MKHTVHALLLLCLCCSFSQPTCAESRLLQGVNYLLEAQTTASNHDTPLWLNANKFGLSSLESFNAYGRAALVRPLSVDTTRKWGVGYGIDAAIPLHFTSHTVLHQAFVEGRWWHGVLTIGSKEQPVELKNGELSSGAQTLGINARPVPTVRLSLPDYYTLPFANGWLHLKGHIAYGKYTDSDWARDFTQGQNTYTEGTLYHSKAGYLKIGNDEVFCPWSLELGLEMASQFGGKTHYVNADGTRQTIPNPSGLNAYWHAFLPGGGDATETIYQNSEGNQLGSWLLRLNYEGDSWGASVYADHFFEDHSSMFFLDYNGYGSGANWDTKEKNRYFLYDLKDIMLGVELKFNESRWFNNIVLEYLNTTYQSGPIYHDHNPSISDHIAGIDEYYNHYMYAGWQHWGQVVGNPLYRSAIYNDDGRLRTLNNRFTACHLGVSGNPSDYLHYRLLSTYQRSFGTYSDPYNHPYENVYLLGEVSYFPTGRFSGWSVKGGLGMDFGKTLGNNCGFQLTIAKRGLLAF